MPRKKSKKTVKPSTEVCTIGERLKALRQKANITQTDLAIKLRLSQKTISDYEIGRNRLPADLLIKICKILKISPSDILE